MIENAAENVVVHVPTTFAINKHTLIGAAAGTCIGVGATLLTIKLKERKARTVTVEVPDSPGDLS